MSTTYYDKTKLTQAYGPTSAALADPSLGDIKGATNMYAQRGNRNYKDAYMFFTITVGYKISKRARSRAKF